MTDITKTITWETGDGRKVVFTVMLKTTRSIGSSDFLGSLSKPCCEIIESATVAGKGTGGYYTQLSHYDTPGVVAHIGALGITQVNFDRIQAAIAELEATDYYMAWQQKLAAAETEAAAYYEHDAAVRKMMGEGWTE